MAKRKKKSKGRVIAKVVAVVIFLLILYMFLPTIKNLVEHPPSLESMEIPAKMTFKFERVINIEASGKYTLNITVPYNNQFQNVQVKDLSGLKKSVIKEYNKTLWQYNLSGSSKITLLYQGTVVAKVWNIKDSLGVNAIPESLKEQYNHNESIKVYDRQMHQYVTKTVITPSAFKEVTEKYTKNDTTVLKKLRTIYNIIVENFRYNSERSGAPNTAIQTWNNRYGDCDELSFVFVSMARSIGIPAWVEYGLVYVQGTWGPHAWIGTVVPTKNGLIRVNIDTTEEVEHKNIYYIGFLKRGADRITEWVDDGNSQHLNAFYSFIRGYYSNLQYSEKINVFYANQTGTINIPVPGSQFPSWLVLFIIAIVILAIFIIIIRF